MFIVALYLPWCRYLAAHEGVQPQLYADDLKCVSRDPVLLVSAARFTTPLAMSGWLVRSLLQVSVSFQAHPWRFEGDEELGIVPGGG